MEIFDPVPEVGKKYKMNSGRIIIVDEFVTGDADGEYVSCSDIEDPSKRIELDSNEWNAEIESVLNPTNSESNDASDTIDDNSDVSEEDKEESEEDYKQGQQNPANSDQTDDCECIRELEDLLEKGPKRFNQSFFPVDDSLPKNDMVESDVEDAFQKTIDEIADIREKGQNIKAGKLNEFLWKCAGSDIALLRMCPIDWAKKAGMGGTILGTSVLAALSGGFAAYTVGENYWAAIIIGLIWGLIIFNLDRYLVNSMYSDGRASISWPELRSGLPRIIIAIFLGLVISTPIELQIFQGAINQELNKEHYARSNKEAIHAADPHIAELDASITALNEKIKPLELRRDSLDRSLEIETKAGGNGRIKGYGPVAQKLDEQLQGVKNELKPLQNRLIRLEELRDTAFNEAQKRNTERVAQEIGLSKRIEMLLKATSYHNADGSQNPLFYVRFLISLMFIILEVLPVVNKMMQEDGQYDKWLDLESDTMDKLARIKEFNNLNVLRSGNLSIYRRQIMGRDIEDEPNEGNNAFYKTDRKRENKDNTEQDNQEIYDVARRECKNYVINKIHKIFATNTSAQNEVSDTNVVSESIENKDQSADAVDI